MNRRFHSLSRISAAILLVVVGSVGCDNAVEPDQPTMELVAGFYRAGDSFGTLSFTTTASGQTVDRLAEGAFVQLDLNANGTTSGRVFIPGENADGTDFDEDLSGTWEIAAGSVRLTHTADTFLRDMDFSFQGNRLEGDETFGGVRVRLVLARG